MQRAGSYLVSFCAKCMKTNGEEEEIGQATSASRKAKCCAVRGLELGLFGAPLRANQQPALLEEGPLRKVRKGKVQSTPPEVARETHQVTPHKPDLKYHRVFTLHKTSVVQRCKGAKCTHLHQPRSS